jgi:hypothetical protein
MRTYIGVYYRFYDIKTHKIGKNKRREYLNETNYIYNSR